MNGAIYITPLGFFGPFALDSGGLFREIAPPNRIQKHELAALPDQRPPDYLAERRHRHQCRDPVRSRRHRRAHPASRAVCDRRLHHGDVHPRRAARRAVYASRVSRLSNKSRAPPALNAHTSLNKLNVCSLSTPLAHAESDAASTRWGNLSLT